MKSNIKIYYLTQKTDVDPSVFEASYEEIDVNEILGLENNKQNDTDYFPIVEETMNFHQQNLLKPSYVADYMTPFTVYYYSMNNITISDSPFTRQGFLDGAIREHSFMSYSW